MPYINKERRKLLNEGMIEPSSPGDLNWLIHEDVLKPYFKEQGVSYKTLNEVIGVLECVKLELYRRLASRYEAKKITENGDIAFYVDSIANV